jgi:hypothetical protein
MLFLYAGILYLIAMAVVLVLKPAFMFRPNGTWKEFGIGRDSKNYTPMPLWIYAIVSALVSYFVVMLIGGGSGSSASASVMKSKTNTIVNMSMGDFKESPDLEPGYYVLNKAASKIAGVPKYVYIGPEME